MLIVKGDAYVNWCVACFAGESLKIVSRFYQTFSQVGLQYCVIEEVHKVKPKYFVARERVANDWILSLNLFCYSMRSAFPDGIHPEILFRD